MLPYLLNALIFKYTGKIGLQITKRAGKYSTRVWEVGQICDLDRKHKYLLASDFKPFLCRITSSDWV